MTEAKLLSRLHSHGKSRAAVRNGKEEMGETNPTRTGDINRPDMEVMTNPRVNGNHGVIIVEIWAIMPLIALRVRHFKRKWTSSLLPCSRETPSGPRNERFGGRE